MVAPSCNDCHGVHDIKRSVDRDSPSTTPTSPTPAASAMSRSRRSTTQSVHGRLLAKGEKQGPICTDCHSAHEIEAPVQRAFQDGQRPALRAVPRGPAHALPRDVPREGDGPWAGRTSRRMSRPATTAMGTTTCCRPPTRLAPFQTNIVATCQQCHADRQGRFHGIHAARQPVGPQAFPVLHGTFLFMTTLLVGVFAFFGGHTAAWLFRPSTSTCTTPRNSARPRVTRSEDGEWFTRFCAVRAVSCISWW